MALASLHGLYIEGWRDLYGAERQMLNTLPKPHAGVTNPRVKDAVAVNHARADAHVARLPQIVAKLDLSLKGKQCNGTERLELEGDELLNEVADLRVLNAGRIPSAQHVEHDEIAGYGTVRTHAQLLKRSTHAEWLPNTLDEGQAANSMITALPVSVNSDAMVAGTEMVG